MTTDRVRAIGLQRSTAESYVKLLEAVCLIYRLPARGTTLGSRVVRHPKVHLTDTGVMVWLLSLTPDKLQQSSPASLTEYGHLLETFAVGEVLRQVSWSEAPVLTGYFRTGAGDEVTSSLSATTGSGSCPSATSGPDAMTPSRHHFPPP